METISSIAVGIIANLLSDGTKAAFKALFSENLNREIERAYNSAVKKWTKNDKERTLANIQQPGRIRELQDAFEHPEKWEKLPEATKELLQLFESELRKTDLTRHYLDSEQHRAIIGVGLENGYKLDEVLKLLDGYVSQQKAHFLTNTPPFADETTVIHRENDVSAIEAELQQHKSLLLVNGFGGIGKTSLAQLVFSKFHERYDEVAWINYQGDLRKSLLAEIQMDALKFCKDDEERIRTIMNLRNDGKSKLFIIDNVDSAQNQNPRNDRLLGELTGWPETTLILTSRLDAIGKAFRRIAVNNLDEAACIDLFYLYYGEDEKRHKKETVRKLVNLVSCHTFSVEQIAKAARQKNLERYYSDLVEKGVGFSTREIDADHARGESLTIAQHLKELFDMQQRTKDEIKALNDIAVLPIDSYSLEEMESWLGYDGDNLEKLTKDGWLSYKDGSYAMHPMVKEIIRLDYDDGKAPQGTATHFLDFISDYKNGYFNESEIYTSTQRKIAIAEAVLEAAETEESELFANIYHNIGDGLEQLADFDKALVYYEKSLKIKEKVLGDEHPSTATTYNNIAGVYEDMGDYGRALEYYEKALKICEEVLGKEHPYTAMTYNNIAGVYEDMGDYGRALEYYEKALEIGKKVFGEKHAFIAQSYCNVAQVYEVLENDAKALEYYKIASEAGNKEASSKLVLISESKSEVEKFMQYQKTSAANSGNVLFRLQKAYDANNLVLVCGAGVSVGSGIPSWDDLLDSLFDKRYKTDGRNDKSLSKYLKENNSSIIVAQYLESLIESKEKNESFEESVRDVLYENVKEPGGCIPAISKLCKNRKVNEIITFNFDDLVETCLEKNNTSCNSVYSENGKTNPEKVNVYHIHGYLPREIKLTEDNKIVLTEETYHSQYIDPYTWGNLVILNCLHHKTCLFVGISFTDPNMRRLAQISKNKKNFGIDHFIIKKKNGNAAIDRLEEEDAKRFGIGTIWIDDFDKISDILEVIGGGIDRKSDYVANLYDSAAAEWFVMKNPSKSLWNYQKSLTIRENNKNEEVRSKENAIQETQSNINYCLEMIRTKSDSSDSLMKE